MPHGTEMRDFARAEGFRRLAEEIGVTPDIAAIERAADGIGLST